MLPAFTDKISSSILTSRTVCQWWKSGTPNPVSGNPKPMKNTRRMTEFVLRFKRWLSIGNGDFPTLFSNIADIDSPLYRRDRKQTAQMVRIRAHGTPCRASCCRWYWPLCLDWIQLLRPGELFAENSSWHELAERRGFLLVYVSAFPDNISGSQRRTHRAASFMECAEYPCANR